MCRGAHNGTLPPFGVSFQHNLVAMSNYRRVIWSLGSHFLTPHSELLRGLIRGILVPQGVDQNAPNNP